MWQLNVSAVLVAVCLSYGVCQMCHKREDMCMDSEELEVPDVNNMKHDDYPRCTPDEEFQQWGEWGPCSTTVCSRHGYRSMTRPCPECPEGQDVMFSGCYNKCEDEIEPTTKTQDKPPKAEVKKNLAEVFRKMGHDVEIIGDKDPPNEEHKKSTNEKTGKVDKNSLDTNEQSMNNVQKQERALPIMKTYENCENDRNECANVHVNDEGETFDIDHQGNVFSVADDEHLNHDLYDEIDGDFGREKYTIPNGEDEIHGEETGDGGAGRRISTIDGWKIVKKAARSMYMWSEWSEWSDCSSPCGPGTQTRTKTCQPDQDYDDICPSPRHEKKACVGNGKDCEESESVLRTQKSLRELHHIEEALGLAALVTFFTLLAGLVMWKIHQVMDWRKNIISEKFSEENLSFLPRTSSMKPK